MAGCIAVMTAPTITKAAPVAIMQDALATADLAVSLGERGSTSSGMRQ
jgi:hypothetical protein